MGEFELIDALRRRLRVGASHITLGVGDDGAITVPEGATATSVDALVDGVHFRREFAPLRSIGHKALASALSDLAAMGAAPGEAYVALGVPTDLDEAGCLEVLAGIEALAERTGTALVGGDVTRSAVLFLTVTVVGHAESADQLLRRSGASPGELLVLTGELGGAAAGLELLIDPRLGEALGGETAALLRGRQLEPTPRLAEGRALSRAGASAMIDLSDGLGADAIHLASESGVSLRIDLGRVPRSSGVAELAAAAGLDPLQLAANGGEDYELLASIGGGALAEASGAIAAAGGRLTAIGEVGEGSGVSLSAGERLIEPRRYDQLDRAR